MSKDASAIVDTGTDFIEADDSSIATVTVEQTAYGMSPNFIKMDIEGAERQAILGSRQTIVDHGPVMAVCLYHRSADLWELPLLLHELRSDYRFHLRVNGDMGIEMVVYAIPRR
ncbi:MAG: FkbM family methyltransferase [Phycisphaeraceae bacterium]|nr:FkbM family methyltransferase [Phycisphaeraceae bacterium]